MNVYLKESQGQACVAVIWMHGLGSNAQDMMGLVNQLAPSEGIRHVFLDAPSRPVTLNRGMVMPAWYDIFGLKSSSQEDQQGLAESERLVQQVIDQQLADGFLPQQIILAGFSQGGAMALYVALRQPKPLAGILALSAYLPLSHQVLSQPLQSLPIFLGVGRFDAVVLPAWSQQVYDALTQRGFDDMVWREYAMEHSICSEEVHDLSLWLSQRTEACRRDPR